MENPVLDQAVLQEKANEFALKGAIETIKEFYSGYNSPYKKAIAESLEGKGLGLFMELPDVVAQINEKLVIEVDAIANTAIAKTFIPQVREFLTRTKKQVRFSDILKKFIDETNAEDIGDCYVEIEEHDAYGWLSVSISGSSKTYDLTLHKVSKHTSDFEEGVDRYQILSLPREESKGYPTMKLSVEGGAVLEMPFRRDVLGDRFTSFIARMLICESVITMDVSGFDEDWFPSHCHC